MLLRSFAGAISMLAIAGLLPGGLVAQETREQLELEKEGTQLIAQLEQVARDIYDQTEILNSLIGNPQVSKETHSHHLEQVKSLVNDGLQPVLNRLTEIQPQLPAWKQHAIDKMLSSAQALASDANSAILSHRDPGAPLLILNDEYKELISNVRDHAEFLVKTSDAAGNYAKAHLQAVEAGLKVPKHR